MFIAKHTVVLRYSFEIKTVVGRFVACSGRQVFGAFAYLLNTVNYTRFAIHLFQTIIKRSKSTGYFTQTIGIERSHTAQL